MKLTGVKILLIFSVVILITQLITGIGIDTVEALKGVKEEKAKVEKVLDNKTLDEAKKMCKSGGIQTAYGTSKGTSLKSIKTNEKNADKVWKKLKELGFSDEASAGIMGNMLYESEMDSGKAEAVHSVNTAQGYGLVQWTGSRRTKLEDFAKKKGKKANDIDLQLEFLEDELKTGYKQVYNKLKDNKNVADSTHIFLAEFEIPNKQLSHDICRMVAGYEYLDKYGGTGSGGKATESSEPDEKGKFDKSRGEYTGNLEFDPFIKQKPVNKSTGIKDGNEGTIQAQDSYSVATVVTKIVGLVMIFVCVALALYMVLTSLSVLAMTFMGVRAGESRIVRMLLGNNFVDKMLSEGLKAVIGIFLLRLFISTVLFLLAITGMINNIQGILIEYLSYAIDAMFRGTSK